MQVKADAQLLREYARQGSEAAFGEIVARYTDLVYATALRQAGSADLAKDIAQSVFTDLARKAASLSGTFKENETIVGWLYRSTRFAVSKHLRAEHRRRIRESLAMQEFDHAAATSPDWERVRPKLDEALADLGEEDRQAMLLRFFQNQNFQTIGAALGISDDTAQKRVGRALEKLRAGLARHGITTTAALLSTVLSANAMQTAPAGLAAKLAGASLASTTVPTATTLIIMTLASKTGIIATGIAVGLAVWLTAEHHSLNRLQKENAALSQQLSQRRAQPVPLTMPKAGGGNTDGELNKLRREHAELLKLRGEVGVLRAAVGKDRVELSAAQAEKAKIEAYQKAEAIGISSVNFLKYTGLASMMYANEHGGLYVTNLGQIPITEFGGSESGVDTNSFEFYSYDAPVTTNTPNHFFYAREQQSRKVGDDQWNRAYLFKDGSVQVAVSSDGNFDQWEKDWIQSHETNK